jgi:hypothetical protein
MQPVLLLMRRFTIRLRMVGAIVMVLGLFAVVAAVGLLGGWQVKTLGDDFMNHSVHEIEVVSSVRQRLAQVRLLEKQMVIEYEDGVQVLRYREAWLGELAATTKALQGLLEGDEDEDNVLAREAVTRLASYAQRSAPVLDNIQIVGEISAAAAEQSTGIGQVNQSVTQLDKTTQQNAALVEESTTAAESLKEQAARLADVVSTFRLRPQPQQA